MRDVTGDFRIRLTRLPGSAYAWAAFAGRHGLKFVHIVLDQGNFRSQPTVTLAGHGPGRTQQELLRRWQRALRAEEIRICRAKVEAAPWADGVPRSDADARDEPADRCFEHRIELLPRPGEPVAALEAYGAGLSRHARRDPERFVTQRCHGVGSETARRRLDELLGALRAAGHEVVQVDRAYVVYDSNLYHDYGWPAATTPFGRDPVWEEAKRTAPAGYPGYPPTYRPLPQRPDRRQRAVFDPAMVHYRNAFRPIDPRFADADEGERWRLARRAAMNHVLDVITAGPWAAHLVLRGSVTMAAWAGEAAREPGDLDFVVTPGAGPGLLEGLKAALGGDIREAAIWTYWRAEGRRLLVGGVQIDLVFGEDLPLAPELLTLPGVARPVLAAPAPLALGWKLLWLAGDMHPQGKDLYDAVLLAEHTTVDLALVRELMRPETFPDSATFTAGDVLGWDVDWANFVEECPSVTGTADEWKLRLAVALERAWTP